MKLTLKILNPPTSRTPVECCLFCFVLSDSLHVFIKYLNWRSNMTLDMAPTENETYNFIKIYYFQFF